jgi:hypothetical protein
MLKRPMEKAAEHIVNDHRIITAYYPIQPRWGLPDCPHKDFIGDPDRQYPMLGLYNNTTDTQVIEFDFRAMKNAGVSVVNLHLFGGFDSNLAIMQRVNRIGLDVGMFWTPTFESYTADPIALSAHTNAAIGHFGPTSAFFRDYDGNFVVFWYVQGNKALSQDANAKEFAHGIDLVRANSGPVHVYLDDACTMGQPCQNGDGTSAPNRWFSGADVVSGMRRVQGFYSWVSVFWAMKADRVDVARRFVNTSESNGFRPIISTTPSYNEINWGYGTEGNNCGIQGDRSRQPSYNVARDPVEWSNNLNAAIGSSTSRTWLYIQAYDEWAEGTTLAPNTYNGFAFLAELKYALYRHGWSTDSTPYVAPPRP